jgi:hypothetical protein
MHAAAIEYLFIYFILLFFFCWLDENMSFPACALSFMWVNDFMRTNTCNAATLDLRHYVITGALA